MYEPVHRECPREVVQYIAAQDRRFAAAIERFRPTRGLSFCSRIVLDGIAGQELSIRCTTACWFEGMLPTPDVSPTLPQSPETKTA